MVSRRPGATVEEFRSGQRIAEGKARPLHTQVGVGINPNQTRKGWLGPDLLRNCGRVSGGGESREWAESPTGWRFGTLRTCPARIQRFTPGVEGLVKAGRPAPVFGVNPNNLLGVGNLAPARGRLHSHWTGFWQLTEGYEMRGPVFPDQPLHPPGKEQ
jgi:hypothetical protein